VKDQIIENITLDFTPEFHLTESVGKEGWIRIGGTALTEGVSRNNNHYSFKNLEENHGKNFKWIVGHSDTPEEDVVGKGDLAILEGKLVHDGKIRNTAKHPDIVEQVKDGFLGPSIHASCGKVTVKDGCYHVEGLSIEGVSLVAFQGVKDASIDYAIAESFKKDMTDQKESLKSDVKNKDKEDGKMSEEDPKPEETPETPAEPENAVPEEPEAPAEEPEEKAEESARIKALETEIASMKESQKAKLVESVVAVNKDLKPEDLMKESEAQLNLRLEYEKKLSSKTEEGAIVEEDEEEKENKDEVVESRDGNATLSEKSWRDFNKELKERV